MCVAYLGANPDVLAAVAQDPKDGIAMWT